MTFDRVWRRTTSGRENECVYVYGMATFTGKQRNEKKSVGRYKTIDGKRNNRHKQRYL